MTASEITMFDFSEDNLDREFPVRKNAVYLNHAAVCPMPARVAHAIVEHTAEVSNFGALHWKKWYRHYDETREKVARLVGGDASRVAFLPSTSHALNLVALAMPWRTGDSVVGDDLEFPANVYPWMNLTEKGVKYRIARSRGGRVTAGDIAGQIDATTRVVAVSWVAFHSGFVFPLAEIGEICSRRGILFVVDAIQGLGTMPLDLGNWKIDVLAADAHKFLYGPEAVTVFALSEKAWRLLGTPWAGWQNVTLGKSYLDYALKFSESARRYEPGSLPTAQIHGLSAAIDLLNDIGIAEVESRVTRLITRLREGLSERGWEIRTPSGSRSAILSAVPPGENPKAISSKLEEVGIVASAREGAVRFSPHAGNSEAEIERTLSAIRNL